MIILIPVIWLLLGVATFVLFIQLAPPRGNKEAKMLFMMILISAPLSFISISLTFLKDTIMYHYKNKTW